MDEIDLNILRILQEKARIPNVEVARQVAMAPSAVLERIRKLEKQGIIDGYEVRLNPDHFARNLVAFIRIAVDAAAGANGVGRALADLADVQEVHYVSGDDGFLVKARVRDPGELDRLVRGRILSIPHVTGTRTAIALSTLKETWRFPVDPVPK